MKFLNLVSMTTNLLEGSHITRLMQDMLIETFKTVIGITQIYEDNDVLDCGASVIMKKIWFLSGQIYKREMIN